MNERPQNKNLKSLGTGKYTPEEEREIRVKGATAANAAKRRNADIRRAVAAVARLNMNGIGRAVDIESLKSVEDLSEKNAPLLARIIYQQYLMAINGDKESRDWICKYLMNDDEPTSGAGITAGSTVLTSAAVSSITGVAATDTGSEISGSI